MHEKTKIDTDIPVGTTRYGRRFSIFFSGLCAAFQ
jgi:hypothetical protein